MGKARRNFCWAKREWGKIFGIIRARSEIGPETSEFLVDEVGVAGSSGCLVN